MNAKVFINYRREDSAPYAGRLYDRLAARLGEDQVFIDIDQIEPGEDFAEVINRKVGTCDIAIVTIGPHWLSATDASGKRRLDNEEDFVRMEIVAALQRKIRVIPVLVGGAQMPQTQDLPQALAPLSRRNAIELSEIRFHADVNRLIEAIENSFAVAEKKTELSATPITPAKGTPTILPVPSTSSIAALKELKLWASQRQILVSGIVLFLFALAGFLMWPVIANPKRLSRPAEPKLTDQGYPTTRRMGQIEEGIRLRGYNLNPNPILVKSADECSKQCEQTDSCLAMTFVKHPNQSGWGDCWLKSAVPSRSSAPPNFASAVKN
jgi:hypothetical protein